MVSSTDGRRRTRAGSGARARGLLDVFAVLVERGGAHDVELTPRQRGLQHVGGIHRPFGSAGTHQRVQLVDEDHVLPSALVISLSTALSRSSNSPRYLVPAISVRDRAPRDACCAATQGRPRSRCAGRDPRRSAVLPTPGSPIRTGLFLVRRDNTCITRRISSSRPMTGSNLALAGQLREVAGEALERLVFLLRLLVGHPVRAAHALKRPP